MPRIKREIFRTLAAVLFFAAVETAVAEPVALPDFSVIGRQWGQLAKAFDEESARVFPKQLTIDCNANGVIYGVAYEYRGSEKLFGELRALIQKAVRVEPKLASTNVVAWRNEARKLTVTLTLEKEAKSIKIVSVSIDKNIRRD